MAVSSDQFRASGLVGYKAASDAIGKASVLAVLMIAARALPTRDFGWLALATTFGWIASVASDFGIQLYLGRAIARAAHPGSVLWPLFRFRVQTGALALAVLATGTLLTVPVADTPPFLLVAAAPLITSVTEFLNYAYRGLGRSELESTLLLAQRLLALALVWGGLQIQASLLSIGLALSASALAALVASIAVARHLTPSQAVDTTAPALTARLWTREVAPIGIGLVLSALYFRVDVFLLERWTGLEAVAVYSAAFRLMDAFRLAPAAVLAVVLPRLFGDRDARFARHLAIGLGGFGLIVTAVTWPLTTWIMRVAYGAAYADAGPVLQILLLSFPLLALNYSLTHQLIGWDRQRAFAATSGIALGANLGLNAWLIPRLGGLGAAWATVGTEVALTVACVVAIQRAHTSR